MILNSPYISGSLTVTGNTTIQGQLTVTGSLSGTASLASNALLLQGTGSTGFATTSSLLQVSSSQQQISASQQQISASFLTLTASYNAVSASQQQISASQQQISSSYIALSASYNTFSGSASTRVTQIEQVYATTGSNSFRATQSITGSLTVTGQIIAQTINVQQVTSSIIYSSGSNVFGCDLNSRQTFTGSFYQTGSVASFSSCVGIGITTPTYYLDVQIPAVTQARFRGCSTDASIIRIENSSNSACFSVGVAGNNNVGSAPNNSLYLRDETNNIVKISMTSGSTGTILLNQCGGNVGIGVTSTNSLLSLCGTFSDTTPLINITGTGTGTYQKVISVVNPGMAVGNDLMIQMGSALSCRNAGQIYFHTDGTGCPTNRVSIGLYQIDNILNVNACANVGINTTAPGTTLMVNRNAPDANWGTIAAFDSQTSAAGVGGVLTFGGFRCSQTFACSIFARIIGAKENGTTGDECGYISIQTNNNSNYVERMRLSSSGGMYLYQNMAIVNGLEIYDTQTYGTNTGGTINFGGKYNSAGTYSVYGRVSARKENSTDGDNSGYMIFTTTPNGGSAAERLRIASTGVATFSCQVIVGNNVCINGSGYGLQFTGGNNRIYFGACRAIEGSTSGTSLQLGEHYTKLSLQAHGQFSCGTAGGSPKLFFGEEGPESAGAKAIYLDSYWMILQPHYNEGLRIRAVNASGTQRTLAEFYGSGEVYFANMAAGAGTYNVKWTSGGRITYDNSSCRYKNNIRNSVYGLCDILKLNSRMFEYKDGGRTDVGLIAEEVNQVIPELAIKNPEGQPDAVSYDRMVSVLIKGMQEQQCKIALLESCLGIQ